MSDAPPCPRGKSMPTPFRSAVVSAASGAIAVAFLSGCSSSDGGTTSKQAPAASAAAPTGCSPQPCARTEDDPPVTVYISGFKANPHPEIKAMGLPDDKTVHVVTFDWRYENRSDDDLDIGNDAFEFYDAANVKVEGILVTGNDLCPSNEYKTIQVPRGSTGSGKACAILGDVPARIDMPYGPTLPVH
ncbi:hypothetical protein [Actinomadura decatromicini]|uniref:DUF4352 domain-containing protein n=1 Tax=Actinomadura decatromicini TaxID=2604572 RepID=A0A5D3FQU1_9ACTN|nr:hypothetical protein [Actinomadura decatromicini]TYK49485.1 hypothetical protein FXF68_17215 [Actinomadura decatromicini]